MRAALTVVRLLPARARRALGVAGLLAFAVGLAPSARAAAAPEPILAAASPLKLLNASIDDEARQLVVVIKHEDDSQFTAANPLNENLNARSSINFPAAEINQNPLEAVDLPLPLLNKEGTSFPKIWYLNDRKIAMLFFKIPSVVDFDGRLGARSGDDTIFTLRLLEGIDSQPPVNVPKKSIIVLDPCPPEAPQSPEQEVLPLEEQIRRLTSRLGQSTTKDKAEKVDDKKDAPDDEEDSGSEKDAPGGGSR